jgi:hypothetical protein
MRIAGCLKLLALIGMPLLAVLVCGPFFLQIFLKSERQKGAIANLYRTQQIQGQFKLHRGRYGSLIELADAGLLEGGFASDATSNYKYWVSDISPSTVCTHADRIRPQAGNCDFALCEDGVLHSRCSKEPGSVSRGRGAQTD